MVLHQSGYVPPNRLYAFAEQISQAYGFCFGAKKLVQGAHEHLFKALAFVHPTNFQPEDADNVTEPVALIPSQGEDQNAMNAFWAKVQAGPSAAKSVRKDFVSKQTFI